MLALSPRICMKQFFVKRPKLLSATSNLRVEQNLVHLSRFMHFSQKVVGVTLRRISCHGGNYSQPYFFKRNQSGDNRSHGFGAKFLLKKLSASDFSYERKSAFNQGYIFYFQFYIYLYTHIHIIFCIYISDKTEAEVQ